MEPVIGAHFGPGSDGSTVYTIEGNTSNSCARRSYSINSSVIVGYGRLCASAHKRPECPISAFVCDGITLLVPLHIGLMRGILIYNSTYKQYLKIPKYILIEDLLIAVKQKLLPAQCQINKLKKYRVLSYTTVRASVDLR